MALLGSRVRLGLTASPFSWPPDVCGQPKTTPTSHRATARSWTAFDQCRKRALFTFDGATVASRHAFIDVRDPHDLALRIDGTATPHVFFTSIDDADNYAVVAHHQTDVAEGAHAETVATFENESRLLLLNAVAPDGKQYVARVSPKAGLTLTTGAAGGTWTTATLAPQAESAVLGFDPSGRLHVVARVPEGGGSSLVDIVEGRTRALAGELKGNLQRVAFTTNDGDPVVSFGPNQIGGAGVFVPGKPETEVDPADRLGVHVDASSAALPVCGSDNECNPDACRAFSVDRFGAAAVVAATARSFFVYGYPHVDRDVERERRPSQQGRVSVDVCAVKRVLAERSRYTSWSRRSCRMAR